MCNVDRNRLRNYIGRCKFPHKIQRRSANIRDKLLTIMGSTAFLREYFLGNTKV